MWDGSQDRFLPPDASTAAFERLGLPTLPAIEKEVPIAHADLEQYETGTAFPDSTWRSEKAAGILLRDKSGNCVAAWHSDRSGSEISDTHQSA